ncbi:hypothetical protein BRUR0010001c01_00046 [Bifidobacterium phage BlindUri1]|nr:hypothetical protein BRUR0010001c01_00046 [Bifidobacterium phage BlindUri1]
MPVTEFTKFLNPLVWLTAVANLVIQSTAWLTSCMTGLIAAAMISNPVLNPVPIEVITPDILLAPMLLMISASPLTMAFFMLAQPV